MKKQLLFLVLTMLPLVASAHDIEVTNTDGVPIYYNYTNNGTELEVTFRGSSSSLYYDRYKFYIVIPMEVTYMYKTYKVTSIGNYAFRGCTGLTSITIPNSVTSIGDAAFYGCSGLTSITIPNSVTSVGIAAFHDCSGLTSVTIPNSVTSIWSSAFQGCSSLTSVTIGNSVTSIGGSAFAVCSGLTSITIPNSVTSIGGGAFSYCKGLTSITIPNSVISIGSGAFRDCSGLTSVTALNPTPIAITQSVFPNRNNATLYVPQGSKEAYQAADYWKEFNEIIELYPGDANGDDEVNITDITYIIDKINNNPAGDFNEKAADLNGDGEINITDVTLLLDIINGVK